MGSIFKTDSRRIIPRWRSFEIASKTGELILNYDNRLSQRRRLVSNLEEQKEAWARSKTLSHAGDLLSSAFVAGKDSEFVEVASFILDREGEFASPLRRLAVKILGNSSFDEESPQKIQTASEDILDAEIYGLRYQTQIKRYKRLLINENRNPIAWIELGRLYTLTGNVRKAQKAVDAALHLEKNNRFIVRSASRFYHHFHGDKDFALQIVKRSEFLKYDPWLMSAEIAYSNILGRHSKIAKIGERFMIDKNSDGQDITELASALGTLEFSNGKIKEARKYLNAALIDPNDNSLAQVSWMSDHVNGIKIDLEKYEVPYAYEAKAHEEYEQKKFKESYDNALRWYKDEPYSSRPVKLASYIGSTFLDKNADAISLIEEGLRLSPKDAMLTNNLIYFLIEAGRVEDATRVFKRHVISELDNMSTASKISFTATTGLILFRNGSIEEGRIYYQKALVESKKDNNVYLIALATCNLVREEILIATKMDELDVLLKQLTAACSKVDEPDITVMHNKVRALYRQKFKIELPIK